MIALIDVLSKRHSSKGWVMEKTDEIYSGSIPFSLGAPTVFRIPIPGTNGLCVEFSPRGRVPSGGSTSTLFFQDKTGNRHLRLDYGHNVKTNTIDFHWNQKGTYEFFAIKDHAAVNRYGPYVHRMAKYYKYLGRSFLVSGLIMDAVSVAVASNPIRRATEVVSGWALAWAGCQVGGSAGASWGAALTPYGIAIGGVTGCIIGGYIGYQAGTEVGGTVYDWGDTVFTQLAEERPP